METASADSLSGDFVYENDKDFWFNVNLPTQSSLISSDCVDDVTEQLDISNFGNNTFE